MRIEQIDVGDIDVTSAGSDEFVFTFGALPWELMESIKSIGVVAPVALRNGGPQVGLRVVCGYRRVLACRELGIERVPARLFQAEELSAEQSLCMSIADNALSRGFNEIEQARIVSRFADQYTEFAEQALQPCPDLLRRVRSERAVAQARLLLSLDEEIKLALCQGTLVLGTALLLAGLNPANRLSTFRSVFVTCEPGLNEAKKIVKDLRDLASMAGTTVRDILAERELREVLDDQALSSGKRCSLLRATLRERRYPVLSQLEERFQQAVKEMGLPAGVSAAHSEFFEDDRLRVNLTAASAAELEAQFRALLERAETGKFDKLFAIANDEVLPA